MDDAEAGAAARAARTPQTPRVSVVVPHYHDLRALDLCLSALERQTFPREDFEIVVADNASPEGEAAVRAIVAGRARLTRVEERGAGPTRNGAVALARGEIVAFTDCDCVPEPDWLREGVSALRQWDLVGGRVKVLVDDPRRMSPAEAFESVFAFPNETYVRRKGFSVTANLFCARAVFDQVGGFISAGVAEDNDWCYRAREAGFRIGYAPAAVVGHPARKTWADLLKKWRRANTELFGLTMLEKGGRAMWLLKSLAQPAMAVIQTPKVLFSPDVQGPASRLKALWVLYRLRFWRFGDSLRLCGRPTPRVPASGR
jgi:GT2 family glycosyltransferase